MATFHVYRLEPRAAFHFGARGVGLAETGETFRSDALFGALCATVREGWGVAALDRLLEDFQAGEPPFRLSSCFPYAGDVLFFPRPLAPLPGELSPDAAKRLKTTRYVSQTVFERWLAGADLGPEARPANFLASEGAWVVAAEREQLARWFGRAVVDGGAEAARLWTRDAVPRVTVDRVTNASAVYRQGRLVFRAGCGLYFLTVWRDAEARALIERALALLGDAGLGGRRSVGYGQFRARPAETIELAEPAGADALLTLSLYWPTPAEVAAGVLAGPARYDLVARYGWMSSPDGRALRRREVRMVAEGSLLNPAGRPSGALADVTPEGFTAHRVYRSGLALTVPALLGEAGDG